MAMNVFKSGFVLLWGAGLACSGFAEEQPAAKSEASKPAFAPEDTSLPDSSNDDPFASSNTGLSSRAKIPVQRGNEVRARFRFRLEIWELETKKIALQLDAIQGPADLESWRKELLADPTTNLVHAPVLGLDERTAMLGESIFERIYPTEYEPPELPPSGLDPKDAKPGNSAWERWLESAGKHAVPTSFETRNTGQTIEAILQPVDTEPGSWDASVSVDLVDLPGMEHFGADDLLIGMPAFTSVRANGIVRLKEGEWRIFTALESPRETLDDVQRTKSWLTLVRVDRVR